MTDIFDRELRSMTDRELLELAAKAGLPDGFEWNGVNQCIEFIPSGSVYYRKWRPLEDDGDALRLAAALGLDVGIRDYDDNAYTVVTPARPLQRHENPTIEEFNGDRFAATRRAIVRAAAEIAKTS